jgi:hypothetical protein
VACSKGCPTPGKHKTWGECLRSKGVQVADVQAHKQNQSVNRELNDYRAAREAGLQPAATTAKAVRQAWTATDATGTPFRADA